MQEHYPGELPVQRSEAERNAEHILEMVRGIDASPPLQEYARECVAEMMKCAELHILRTMAGNTLSIPGDTRLYTFKTMPGAPRVQMSLLATITWTLLCTSQDTETEEDTSTIVSAENLLDLIHFMVNDPFWQPTPHWPFSKEVMRKSFNPQRVIRTVEEVQSPLQSHGELN